MVFARACHRLRCFPEYSLYTHFIREGLVHLKWVRNTSLTCVMFCRAQLLVNALAWYSLIQTFSDRIWRQQWLGSDLFRCFHPTVSTTRILQLENPFQPKCGRMQLHLQALYNWHRYKISTRFSYVGLSLALCRVIWTHFVISGICAGVKQ